MKVISSIMLLFLSALIIPSVAVACTGDCATFVSQSVPYEMASGDSGSPVSGLNGLTYNVSVTFLNSGTTTWTSNYRLGAQSKNYVCPPNTSTCVPTDAAAWGVSGTTSTGAAENSGRVYLNPEEQISPGQEKTFNFIVRAPAQPIGALTPIYNFQWQMVNEGVAWFGDATPNIPVTVLVAPAVQEQVAINVPPVPSAALNFDNFRGANVKESIYDPNNPYFAWFPSAGQMTLISEIASEDMHLNVFRLPVFLPPSDAADNQATMDVVLTSTESMLDIANQYGIKVIIELDGYLQYDQACGVKGSFESVQANAQTLVQALSRNPALYAWDLANEPMWDALNPAMLNVSNQLETGGPSTCMSQLNDYQEVYNAVRSMYNLVRANDPTAMTTVGENQLPYQAYWNDISSFATPHIYIEPTDLMNAVSYSSAIPSSVPVNTQIQLIEAGTISQLQSASTTSAGALPLVVGEWGWSIPPYTTAAGIYTDPNLPPQSYNPASFNATNEITQLGLYQSFYQTLQTQNVGSMFWDLSLGYGSTSAGAPQFYSLLQSVVSTDNLTVQQVNAGQWVNMVNLLPAATMVFEF